MYCETLYLFFIEMMAGRIGQIGWKSIEMVTQMLLHWSNSTDSTRSNWVQIHRDYIVCLPGQIRWLNWVEIH